MDGGTLPDTFDWHSFMSPIPAGGPSTFTSPGPYTTDQGFESTGIVYGTAGWDNGTLATSCPPVGNEATGSPGSQTQDSNPWLPGTANVNAKGDLCSGGAAYEIVTDDQDVDHVVFYMYWTRLDGDGDMSTFETLQGPEDGRCDDFLIEFNYDSANNTTSLDVLTWTPTAGDDCADPNGAGTWQSSGMSLDYVAAVGGRTEGPAVGMGEQGTFGELAVDLTTAGLFSPDTCTGFATGTGFSRTGNSPTAEIQDYFEPQNPLIITNCGGLSITKLSDPPASTSQDVFDYTVKRSGGGAIFEPDADVPDQFQIDDSLQIGDTDIWSNVLAGDDYTLAEFIDDGLPWTQKSITCQIDDEVIEITDPTTEFPVETGNVTACTIVNSTSWVTLEKQTLPDGTAGTFDLSAGDTHVQLADNGVSDPIYFKPGTEVPVAETVPAGWDLTSLVCDGETLDNGDSVTTVAGEGTHCVFTNTAQPGEITVTKTANGNDGTFEFTLTPLDENGDPSGEPFVESVTTVGGTGVATFEDVEVGGRFSLAETSPGSPWTAGELTCTVDPAGEAGPTELDPADFTVNPGDAISCAITNSTSWVTIEKQTLPDGSDETFEFDVEGTQVELGDDETSGKIYFTPGTEVSVTETVPEGWNLTSLLCDGQSIANGGAVTTVAGEGVHCVFTNTQNGEILVHKIVDGPQGAIFTYTGSWLADPSTFQIDATDGSGDSEIFSVVPGSYDLAEQALEGYDTTNLVCVDPDDGTEVDLEAFAATLDVDPGERVECTFTNTQRGEIRVDKETIPDEWDQDFDFSLTGEGTDEQFSLNDSTDDEANPWSSGLIVPGDYTVAETVPAHWELDSISCGTPEGASTAIVLEPGAVITCVFTNEALPGSVSVEKSVEGVADGFEWSFDLTISPVPGEQDGTQTVTGTGNGSDTVTWTDLVPGQHYTVTESAVDGWNMGEITCTGGGGALEDLNGDEPGFEFVAEIDTVIDCALTNEAQPGEIEVAKSTVGGDGTFDFELTPLDADGEPAGDPIVESVTTEDGAGTVVFGDILPGSRFSLAEADPGEAWVAGALTCTVDPVGEAGPQSIDASDFTVQPGDAISCEIENVARGPLEIVKTVDGPAVDNGDGTWDVSYTITVTSKSATDESYDLSDELKFGDGITPLSASITGPEGVTINPDWDGIDDIAVTTAVVPAGGTHVYAVSVTADVEVGTAASQADCEVGAGEDGTGLLNAAEIEFWSGTAESEDCAPVTPEQPPAPPLPSTGVSLAAGGLALAVIAAGGLLLFLRRRRSA